jgi:hypothetical protein
MLQGNEANILAINKSKSMHHYFVQVSKVSLAFELLVSVSFGGVISHRTTI